VTTRSRRRGRGGGAAFMESTWDLRARHQPRRGLLRGLTMPFSADTRVPSPPGADTFAVHPTAGGLGPGQHVLALGPNARADAAALARTVGPHGRVVVVDGAPEVVEAARLHLQRRPGNLEFRLGEVEHLPVADAAVDAVVAHQVVSWSHEPERVLRELFRVLRPGGALHLCDFVALPDSTPMRRTLGALPTEWLRDLLDATGFVAVRLQARHAASADGGWLPHDEFAAPVVPAQVWARRPPS
jgi:arsenite methyltransferase